MAGPALGWAQKRMRNNVTMVITGVLNAFVDTTQNPSVITAQSSDLSFEAVAGSPVSIRWGGSSLTTGWTGGLAANFEAIFLTIFDEKTGTVADGGTDSVTVPDVNGVNASARACHDHLTPAAGAFPATVDRTVTFTPTHSSTYRLYVRCVSWTGSGAATTRTQDQDTDNGNAGLAVNLGAGGTGQIAPVVAPGQGVNDFSPGLLRLNDTTFTESMSGAPPYFYTGNNGTAIVATLTFAHAPPIADASETMNLLYEDSAQATIGAASLVSAVAAAAHPDNGKFCQPSSLVATANYPFVSRAIGLEYQIANSALSTSGIGNGPGTATPWVAFVTLPAGWTKLAGSATAATDFRNVNVFTADDRLKTHCHLQKTGVWPHSPPDPGAPSPYDAFSDDTYLFIISADQVNVWFAAFNENAVGINAITGTIHLSDPSVLTPTSGGGGDHTATPVTATTGGNPLGWSRQSLPQFTGFPQAPAGDWHLWCESATDGASIWQRSTGEVDNQQGHQIAGDPFFGFASDISFVSAFRDNLMLDLTYDPGAGAERLPRPGDTVRIQAQGRFDTTGVGDFTPLAPDIGITPTIKIGRYNRATGVLTLNVGSDGGGGGALMTVSSGDPTVWFFDWNTAGLVEGYYVAIVEMFLKGGPKPDWVTIPLFSLSAFDPVAFATGGSVVSFEPR